MSILLIHFRTFLKINLPSFYFKSIFKYSKYPPMLQTHDYFKDLSEN